jgi:hypothetical protein
MLMYKPSRWRGCSADFADQSSLLGFSGATEGRDKVGLSFRRVPVIRSGSQLADGVNVGDDGLNGTPPKKSPDGQR